MNVSKWFINVLWWIDSYNDKTLQCVIGIIIIILFSLCSLVGHPARLPKTRTFLQQFQPLTRVNWINPFTSLGVINSFPSVHSHRICRGVFISRFPNCNLPNALDIYTGWPPKNGTVDFVRTLLWSTVILLHLAGYYRPSFPHYNNTKIIKFGWQLFILWVISYGLSFSGFARFPEFRGTITDSFGRPYIERVLCSVIRVLPNKDLQSSHVIGTEISL